VLNAISNGSSSTTAPSAASVSKIRARSIAATARTTSPSRSNTRVRH
jgi:hypothetical protein